MEFVVPRVGVHTLQLRLQREVVGVGIFGLVGKRALGGHTCGGLRQEGLRLLGLVFHRHITRKLPLLGRIEASSHRHLLFAGAQVVVAVLSHDDGVEVLRVAATAEGTLKFLRVLAGEVGVGHLARLIIDIVGTLVGHLRHGLRTQFVGPGSLLLGVGVGVFGVHGNFLRETVTDVDAGVQTGQSRTLCRTALIEIGERIAVGGLLATARHRETVVGSEGILGEVGEPVDILVVLVEISPLFVIADFGCVEQVFEQSALGVQTQCVVPDGVLDIGHVVVTAEHGHRLGLKLEGVLGGEGEAGLAHGTLLGGDEQHTVGTGCTIDGCRGGILQHLDTLDVIGVEGEHLCEVFLVGGVEVEGIVDVGRVGHTVDDDERVGIAVECGGTTDADIALGTGVTGGDDVHTAELSLQRLLDRGNGRDGRDVVHVDFLGGKSHLSFGHTHLVSAASLTLHRYLLDLGGGVAHLHVERGLSGILETLGSHADIGEDERQGTLLVGGHLQRVLSVEIGHRTSDDTFLCILEGDVHTDTRFGASGEIFRHGTRHSLLCHHLLHEAEQENRQYIFDYVHVLL